MLKIGGSILRSGKSYEEVAEEVKREVEKGDGRLVIVVSAMNKVTDELLSAYNGCIGALENVVEKHVEAAYHIGGERLEHEVYDLLSKLRLVLGFGRRGGLNFRDLILSFGEKLSSLLLIEALENSGVKAVNVDAVEVVKTRSEGENPPIDYLETFIKLRSYLPPLLEEGVIPVIEGFIASTRDGKVRTLGRGGSDYTATTIAALMRASKVKVVSNVPGILTADPEYVEDARPVPRLSYEEAIEASIYGCKRVHPRTFHPLKTIHGCKVLVGSWDRYTVISRFPRCRFENPKLVAFKVRGRRAYAALIGDGIVECGVFSKAIDMLENVGLEYEGAYAFRGRPSIVFIFKHDRIREAIKTLHNIVEV